LETDFPLIPSWRNIYGGFFTIQKANNKLTNNYMADEKQQESIEVHHIPQYDPTAVFTTFDLGAAAALVHMGFELLSLDRVNPKKIKFVFKKNEQIEQMVSSYWADTLSVGARGFFDTIKMLKNRIYSE
jgi:hypothetical protein